MTEGYEWVLEIDVKGGPGSGHWGHAGRPGQVGGSAPGKLGGSGQVNREYFTKGPGKHLIEDMAPHHQERTISVLTQMGVQPRHLGNLKKITTEATYAYPEWYDVDDPDFYILGCYDPATKTIHLNPRTTVTKATISHELGHHVYMESKWYRQQYRVWPVSERNVTRIDFGHDKATYPETLKPHQLWDMGLREYSLVDRHEWAADVWKVYQLGTGDQRERLGRFLGVGLDELFGG